MAFTATLPVIVFLFQHAGICTVSTLRQYSSFKKTILHHICQTKYTENSLENREFLNNGLLETRAEEGAGGEGGVTRVYRPYWCVLPQRVWFLIRFGMKTDIDLVWNQVWLSRKLRECMNVFIVSITNE